MEESPKNSGFPIVAHWIKRGQDKKTIKNIFNLFFDAKYKKIKGINNIWIVLISQMVFSCINAKFE